MELTKIHEVEIMKEAFTLAIEAKKQAILKKIQEEKLADIIGHDLKNKDRDWIEFYKNQIEFLMECHEKAQNIRIKMSDQRAEAFAKQYKKGRR